MAGTVRHMPPVADRRLGILISAGLFVAFAWFTWAQFDRTGNKPPWFMRWASVT